MSTEPNIKHRVTGAMVLIALAVIFLPLILDGQKNNQTLDSQIPDKPISGEIILLNVEANKSNEAQIQVKSKPTVANILTEELNAAQPEAKEKSKNIVVDEVTPIVLKQENNKPVKKVLKKEATEVKHVIADNKNVKDNSETIVDERQNRPNYNTSAFVIQLGSFSNQTNAKNVVDKLKAAGYKAYLREAKSNNKTIHRVLVGPQLKREQAESKIKALAKLSGLKPLIMVYDPLVH